MIEQILNLVVTPAHADAGSAVAGAPQNSSMSLVIMFAVLFLFMYFAIWRPQNKRLREQADMMSSLAKGDEVATSGGVVGRIAKLGDQFIILSIANNVEIFLQKSSVVSVLPKGTIKSIE
jgi:preprotein translocase subunit YajC